MLYALVFSCGPRTCSHLSLCVLQWTGLAFSSHSAYTSALCPVLQVIAVKSPVAQQAVRRWIYIEISGLCTPQLLKRLTVLISLYHPVMWECHCVLETREDGGWHRPYKTQWVKCDHPGPLWLQSMWHLVHAILHGFLAKGTWGFGHPILSIHNVVFSYFHMDNFLFFNVVTWSKFLISSRCWLWEIRWGSCMCGTWKWKIHIRPSQLYSFVFFVCIMKWICVNERGLSNFYIFCLS